jgi:hypothetical protein
MALDGAGCACARRRRRAFAVPRQQQVGVGLVLAAAHAPAQLVQVRHAEPVGLVDQDRVGVGDVHAAFDDRRAQQHVELARTKRCITDPAPAPICPWPTPMRILGQQLLRSRSAIQSMVITRLCSTKTWPPRFTSRSTASRISSSRPARRYVSIATRSLRRRLDHAHVARPRQAQVQRARNGRGGQRQHVDHLAQPLEVLLRRHPEALFLVDDHQPQVRNSRRAAAAGACR